MNVPHVSMTTDENRRIYPSLLFRESKIISSRANISIVFFIFNLISNKKSTMETLVTLFDNPFVILITTGLLFYFVSRILKCVFGALSYYNEEDFKKP